MRKKSAQLSRAFNAISLNLHFTGLAQNTNSSLKLSSKLEMLSVFRTGEERRIDSDTDTGEFVGCVEFEQISLTGDCLLQSDGTGSDTGVFVSCAEFDKYL